MTPTSTIKDSIHFSFNSSFRPLTRIITQDITPTTESPNMYHLSIRDDCRIKLSAQANKKNKNIVNHEYIQYFVIYPLKIMVRHIEEMVHSIALKVKTGSGKMNWKRISTSNVADKTG